MKRTSLFLALGAAALMPAQQSAIAAHHEAPTAPDAPLHADAIDADGKKIGTVVVEQTPNGVLISASIDGIPAGEHGFHLHETGVCDPATGFKSAGGHYAPRSRSHGLKELAGPHAGDMPNQWANDHEQLRANVLNTNVTLGEGPSSLHDADGTALVVHAGKDDYTSQPSGAAGARLVCAVISPPKEM